MPAVYLANFEPLTDPQVARQQLARTQHRQGLQFPISGREFPVGVPRAAYYFAYLPDYVSSPTIDLLWVQHGGAAGGTVGWLSACAAITPGDSTRVIDKVFASTNSATPAALGDGVLAKTTITVTNTDSLAAGDMLVVRIMRDANQQSCGGTALLLACSINYTGS